MLLERTSADIGIILTDPFDVAALLQTIDEHEALPPTNEDPNFYFFTRIRASGIEGQVDTYHAILAQSSKLGHVGAAMVAKDLIRSFGVKHIVLLGVGEGIRRPGGNGVSLGDVVVSAAPGPIRLLSSEDEPGPVSNLPPPSRVMIAAVNHLLVGQHRGDTPWRAYIDRASGFCPQPPLTRSAESVNRGHSAQVLRTVKAEGTLTTKLHLGLIGIPARASSANVTNRLSQRHGLLALESDASGVADATWDQTEVSDYIIIRGIGSYVGSSNADPAWRRYAALAAASCLRALLDLRPFPARSRTKEHSSLARFGTGVEAGDSECRELEKYLEWLVGSVGSITLRTPDAVLSAAVEDTYVDLDVIASHTSATPSDDWLNDRTASVDFFSMWPPGSQGSAPADGTQREGPSSTTMLSAASVLAGNPASVLVGEPGSGKTTILRFMAHRLATALLSGRDAEEDLGIVGAVPVPVFISLNAYAEHVASLPPESPPEARSLLRFASRYPEYRHACLNLRDGFFESLLRSGRPLALLLDGLDEVSRSDLQLLVGGTLEDLSYTPLPLSIVATARTSAYRGVAVLSQRFRRYSIRRMTNSQIDAILVKMAAAFEADPNKVEEHLETVRSILYSLESRRNILRRTSELLVSTPLMARVLFTLSLRRGRVPARRSEFISDYINSVLDVSYHPDVLVALRLAGPLSLRPLQRQILRRLAFEIQMAQEDGGRPVTRLEFLNLVCEEIKGKIGTEDVGAVAEQIIAALTQRAGLISADRKRVAFAHSAFQELLVGEYMATELRSAGEILAFVGERGRVGEELWCDSIGHAIAFASEDDVAEAAHLVEAFLTLEGPRTLDAEARRLAVLAEACVEQSFGRRLDAMVTDRACKMLFAKPSLGGREPELAARLGTLLGHLGDPRLQGSVPKMIECEAGGFLMGHTPDPELVDLPSLQSGVYEVATNKYGIAAMLTTNTEFSRFVEAGGYGSEGRRFWSEDGWEWRVRHSVRAPAFWDSPTWACPNHPVVGVSWFEAFAYCCWLAELTGRRFRLPTEAEWERAAQDADGGSWPWGSVYDPRLANTLELGLGRTTCVGLFPEGASICGVLDAAGNVWEWCRSQYRTYAAYTPVDGREDESGSMPRCIRGGSWLNSADRARVANRDHYSPGDRHSDLGFRVAEEL